MTPITDRLYQQTLEAAERADWMQVVLNQGPPCFHLEDSGKFCLRAQRWAGHTYKDEWPEHRFVSLAALIAALTPTPTADRDTIDKLTAENERLRAELAAPCPPDDVCPACGGATKANRPFMPCRDRWHLEPEPAPQDAERFDFLAHLRRQRAFSERTFGPGIRTAGVVDHIRKELREIESAPADLSEWIDVVILALDGAWRAGHMPEVIIEALAAKQAKNEARTWPDWRTAAPDKAIEHVKTDARAEGPTTNVPDPNNHVVIADSTVAVPGVEDATAYREADRYLRSLWHRLAPQCETLPSLAGVATQIDNYIAGLLKRVDELRAGASAPAAGSALDNGNIFIFCDYVDERRSCIRGAGHNGPHAMHLGPPQPLSPVLLLAPVDPAQ